MPGDISTDKNKAAQKRYRERKKGEVLDLKCEIERLNRELTALKTEKECLEVRNRVLGKTLEVQTAQRQQPCEAERQQAGFGSSAELHAALSALAVAVGKEPLDSSAYDFNAIKALHSALVLKFSQLLHVIKRSGDREAEADLEEFALKHRQAAIDLLKALDAKSFAQLHQARGISPELPEETLRSAVGAAGFTASQRQAYCTARRELLELGDRIKSQRARDCDLLHSALCEMQLAMSKQGPVLEACQAVKALQQSFQDMYEGVINFYVECIQINTPVQDAELFVETFPGVPDPFAVATLLATQDAIPETLTEDPSRSGKDMFEMMLLPELDDLLGASLEEYCDA